MPIRPGCYGHIKGQGRIAMHLSRAVPFRSMALVPPEELPNSVDLHRPEWISPCYDQLQTSSCVLNMWASITEYGLRRTPGMPAFTPSRLYAYWNNRSIEGDTGVDGGSYCHDSFHQGYYYGILPETEYPFSDDPAIVLAKPPERCFIDALKIRMPNFAYLDNTRIIQLKTCLAHGYPFGGGFDVPSNFESESFSENPILTLAGKSYKIVGGHGVSTFGYDDDKQTDDGPGAFCLRNSWGTDWGEYGKFWVSYKFMTSSMFSDCWMGRFPGQKTSLSIAA